MARTTPQKKHNQQKFEHHIYSLLVENKFGVLSRVSGLFARRGFNIYSLAVNPTEDEAFSRMTIVVDAQAQPLEQVTEQLNKLIPIIKINEIRISSGAGFIVAMAGEIIDMPGLPKKPAAESIDIDKNGKITGLF